MGGLALKLKQSIKVRFEKKLASKINKILRHYQIDGELLRVFTTTLFLKNYKGSRLIIETDGNNVKNWKIRSQAPNKW